MSRLLNCVVVLALVTPALAQEASRAVEMKLQVVVAQGGNLIIEEPVAVTKYVPQTVERVVNGTKMTFTVTAPVVELVLKRTATPLKDVSVHDLAGAKIDPDRVPEMLKKPTAVVISSTGEIDKTFRELLKEGALIVVLPTKPTAPPVPAAPRQ
jgi:hypothetical protein